MTNHKWKVRRRSVMWGDGFFGPRWCIIDPHGSLRGDYPTWKAAQLSADRLARSRTIVLPRDPFPMKIGKKFLDLDGECLNIFGRRASHTWPLHRKHWRPLALALLALDERAH